MLRHYSIVLLLVGYGFLAQAPTPRAERPCRQHPRVIGRCFSVYGRLSIFNGAPALRIWRVGTRRMLGVSGERFVEEGYRNVPEYIESQLNQDTDLFGDFVVCPFTRSKPREMQLVCIESGKNLVVRARK